MQRLKICAESCEIQSEMEEKRIGQKGKIAWKRREACLHGFFTYLYNINKMRLGKTTKQVCCSSLTFHYI